MTSTELNQTPKLKQGVTVDMLDIAWKSLRNRWTTAVLATLAIAMSVALITSVETVRTEARNSFTRTISGTDLIIGARSGAVQLLLYSVFRIGNATNNISWKSVEELRTRPKIDWVIPLSLGDSHRGFRVLGTTLDYFEHFRFGDDRQLALQAGAPFNDVFDAVIGSEVAKNLDYSIGHEIAVAHGTGNVGLVQHDKQPFRISGILEPTGTPVDRTVHVSLEGIEAMHVDWRSGMKVSGPGTAPDQVRQMDLQPRAVTALLVGLTSRAAVFSEQRAVNTYRDEPLLAILPGVALQELWQLVGVAENALFIVSLVVVLAGLVNLVSVLLAGLNERRREMAILRANGARPLHIFLLLCIESMLLTSAGILLGLALHYVAVGIGGQWMQARYGMELALKLPSERDFAILAGIFLAGLLAGCLPAYSALRRTLADGMTQRM